MESEDLRPSENVEDRRGMSAGTTGGLGLGVIVVLTLLGWALGINPAVLIGGAQMLAGGGSASQQQQQQQQPGPGGTPGDASGKFVARVLGETEDVWTKILPEQTQQRYVAPKLVLFSGQTASACGTADSAVGPFYCPLDQKVYLDTAFFADMQRRLGGGGDFAYAYVIAHEVGHHVQNLIGVLPKVDEMRRRSSPAESNALSVKLELMADCFAGVWGNQMNARHHNIDDADVRQAVSTATAIGDDRLQRQARGTVVPDSFTHGTSEQRVQWLTTGLKSGTVAACNTFS
jgi:predicted metalloprotease